METSYIEPTKIKIRPGADRYRSDMGDVKTLADSFKRTRQILPIVVTRNFELIDGGRRLAACILNQMKVKYVFEDVVDFYEMRELELEANLHRKDYTPAEEALAIRDLHKLRQMRLGVSSSGKEGGHTLQDTANLIGKSKATVINALEMAELIDAFPQLRQAKKKGDIKKAARGLVKLSKAMDGMKAHAEALASSKQLYQLFNEDAVLHMKTIPDKSIDILLTDPIYGIDADQTCIQVGGKTGGGLTTSGYKIEDTKKSALHYYRALARESIRFCSDESHAYIFIGPEHYHHVSRIFTKSGWRVHIKPLIWIKREVGQCNVPSAWPASCYEMLLYCRRDNSRIIKEGMPDWIECPPVDPSKRLHPFEKPIPLLQNLLSRVCLPGQTLLDPFMGSGSSIEAGLKAHLFCIGVDLSIEAYSMALSRMSQVLKEITS